MTAASSHYALKMEGRETAESALKEQDGGRPLGGKNQKRGTKKLYMS
jgi:hypothetical protein